MHNQTVPAENHQVPSENLKDYMNWEVFSSVDAVYYKSQDGGLIDYNTGINGTCGDENYIYIYPGLNASLVYSLDFGTSGSPTSMNLGLAASIPSGDLTEINVYVDSPSTTPISTVYLTDTGSWTT